jgi:hypothetical protein
VTLLTGVAGSLLTTCLIAPTMPGDLTALLQETWRTIEIIPVPFWMLLGTVGAYRLGTRSWI